MKKFICIIVFAMMIILPMSVNAEIGIKYNCDEDKVTQSDGTETLTCYITGMTTNGSTISQFTGTLNLVNLSIKSITASSPWTDYSVGTNLSLRASSSVSSASFTIATIVYTVTNDNPAEKCYSGLRPCYDENGTIGCGDPIEVSESYTCKIVDGTYYGKNGNVVTEAVYNSECVKNPQTGNFVPYVVIAAGIFLAVVVFNVSRKNNALYKI